jgi:hypothetical protein
MNSHDLARLLLTLPDLPVASVASGHIYSSVSGAVSHGPLAVTRLRHYAGDHIMIGNSGMGIPTKPGGNWWIAETFYAEPRW